MKKYLTFFLILILTLTFSPVFASSGDITVYVNNIPVEFDTPPVIVKDRTMVPIRETAEALGAEVAWDEPTKTATVVSNSRTVKLTQNNPYFYINDIRLLLDAPPLNINGRIHIPLRNLAESLDVSVIWDAKFRSVDIISDRHRLTIEGKEIVMGDPISLVEFTFGAPDRIDTGIDRFDWYVYNSDYSKFMMVGVLDGKVTSIYTAYTHFVINGILKFGDKYPGNQSNSFNLYYDEMENNKIYGVWMGDCYSTEAVLREDFFNARVTAEKQLIDVTNAFRNFNGLSILREDIVATTSCRKHSQDMADNNYFSQINLQNQTPWDRYESIGGKFYACAENITYDASTCQDAFDNWLNNPEQRNNMLHPLATYIGSGMGYNPKADHMFYTTQLFCYVK